ncbi:MAG TPA: response regulator transcription factor [Noviherbaspirillum sp.]|nr:response regulator transcription factor [Noviherbaspirillum sp.]
MRIACNIRCNSTFHRVQEVLAGAGFDCTQFITESAMIRALRRESYDLILIETSAEAHDDRSAYSWLNCRTGESTPVVMLSENCTATQVAAALEAGVDEVMGRSVDPVLFVARLNAILRRCNRVNTRGVVEIQGFMLDRDACIFLDRGEQVALTRRELDMAWLFFSSPGIYLSREAISVAVWGVDIDIASRTIEQHVYKLRKKLNLCSERGVRIRTAYSKGYRLELCEEIAQQEKLAAVPLRKTHMDLMCS